MQQINCVWDAKAELGEGVFWLEKENAVYWVDIFQSMLHRLSAAGDQRSWHFPGRASAVMPLESGGLLASFENGLCHIDLDEEQVTPLLALEADLPNNRFNDGCTDTRGQFWFGSMDDLQQSSSGRFYRLDLSGKVHRLDSFGEICITNGPAFSTDGAWVYFTDTLEKKIYRASLNQLGEPGDPELFIDFSTLQGHPDGMCCDTAGGLWVCHFGGGRVTRFGEDGKFQSEIQLPVPNITKCAFGGSDMSTLYITTARAGLEEQELNQFPLSGGLFAVDVPYTGVSSKSVIHPPVG
jgi:xylono-1,5-lactonase